MLNYTTGNWTVTSKYSHSVQTPKSVEYPTLSTADFREDTDKTGEKTYASTTSTDSFSHLTLRFGISNVNNVYNKTGIDAEYQDVTKSGRQILVEVKGDQSAVNSVNGKEVRSPFVARVTMVVPNGPFVTSAYVDEAIDLLMGALDGCRLPVAASMPYSSLDRITTRAPQGDLNLD